VALTERGFETLLESLDPDRQRAGEIYERLRRKLLGFFEWRGCACPEDLADRAIDRASRKMEGGERLRLADPWGYFYAIAQNILREHWTERRRDAAALRGLNAAEAASAQRHKPAVIAEESENLEEELRCLEACLTKLPARARELIVRYYQGDRGTRIENRKALATELGIPLAALRNRSLRLRLGLHICMEECLKRAGKETRI
jgi:DNA-directed RNA polymerase specialized sigma24 family protein